MQNNAQFIKTEDLKALGNGTPQYLYQFIEVIEKNFQWVKAVAWVDAGFIMFGSQACMLGWLACQD